MRFQPRPKRAQSSSLFALRWYSLPLQTLQTRKNEIMHAGIVAYTNTGGTVVYCGYFASMIQYPQLAKHFCTAWDLSLTVGAYTKVQINPNNLCANIIVYRNYSK